MKIKITFHVLYILTKQTFRFIRYLIKNKNNSIILLMQRENFYENYNIQYDGKKYLIHTNIIDLMYDIEDYDEVINLIFNEPK